MCLPCRTEVMLNGLVSIVTRESDHESIDYQNYRLPDENMKDLSMTQENFVRSPNGREWPSISQQSTIDAPGGLVQQIPCQMLDNGHSLQNSANLASFVV